MVLSKDHSRRCTQHNRTALSTETAEQALLFATSRITLAVTVYKVAEGTSDTFDQITSATAETDLEKS